MKKFGVIIYKNTDNLGDDIQTYAAYKLLPQVDYFIDREHLDEFHSKNGEKIYCIFNGWFLYNNINWPPSNDIIPLPISMHFTDKHLRYNTSKDLFIKRVKDYFNYFNDNGVGCRDTSTMSWFKDIQDKYLSSNNLAQYEYCLFVILLYEKKYFSSIFMKLIEKSVQVYLSNFDLSK